MDNPPIPPKKSRPRLWEFFVLLLNLGALIILLGAALLQVFPWIQVLATAGALIVLIVLGKWLRLERRYLFVGILFAMIGSIGLLYWLGTQLSVTGKLDAVSRRLCHADLDGYVSVSVYQQNDKVIGYARVTDSRTMTDSRVTEYYNASGNKICMAAAFSGDDCRDVLSQHQPPIDVTVRPVEVCSNFSS